MRHVFADRGKAKALLRMAELVVSRIRETSTSKYASQILKDYYDALHGLMEALAAAKGVKTEGEGAHEKLIEWAAKECGFSESDRQFLHMLRRYRNRISYEGFSIEPPYIERNRKRILNLYDILKTRLNKAAS